MDLGVLVLDFFEDVRDFMGDIVQGRDVLLAKSRNLCWIFHDDENLAWHGVRPDLTLAVRGAEDGFRPELLARVPVNQVKGMQGIVWMLRSVKVDESTTFDAWQGCT